MDNSFEPSQSDLKLGLDLLLAHHKTSAANTELSLHPMLPEKGIGEHQTLELLAPSVLGNAAHLGSAMAFANMDPPTPWITWITQLWNASLNQNLLHTVVSPVATEIERVVIDWLSPHYGMTGGHMTPGSTVANLTALWAARDLKGINRIVASEVAHISVDKAAKILGMDLIKVPCDQYGALDSEQLPQKLNDSVLVLTAGTTSHGAIDSFDAIGQAAWTHVDAAWAGPLQLSEEYSMLLTGIEFADSVAMSAHKWLFQPKESGVLMFKDVAAANEAISMGGAYLKKPNVGLLGSHGAVAVPLLATLTAWGREGIAQRIETAMHLAEALYSHLQSRDDVTLFGPPTTGVILWRPTNKDIDVLLARIPADVVSSTMINGQLWLRHVAANPHVDITAVCDCIDQALK